MTVRHDAVVVTGAVGGLGSAIVARLLADGCRVIACDRDLKQADGWLARFGAAERSRLELHGLDVTREEDVAAFAAGCLEAGAVVTGLVNNAGVHGAGEATRAWRRTLAVSLDGTFFMTRAFAPAMRARRFGRIVNIASQSAYHPDAGQGPYAAAKAAVTGYTRSCALDFAADGVTVNAIAPGLVLHDGLKVVFSDADLERLARGIPVGRAGRPDEIAATVAFLLAPGIGYLTGQTLHVNGGSYLPG